MQIINTPVQTIVENNEIFFRAAQLAELLQYKNPHKAIKDHVDPDDLTKREIVNTINKRAQVLFVNESGMCSLVLSSKLEQAKKVKRWVTSEVLPAIRKTGQYQLQPQQMALPEPEKTFNFELTKDNIHDLVWLLFSHSQMNWLLGKLMNPLEAIGSSYSPAVVGHHNEYKRHYRDCLPLIQQFIAPLKQANPQEWQQLQRRLSDK